MSPSGNGHRRFARPDDELSRLMALAHLGRNGDASSAEHDVLAGALTAAFEALPGHAIAIARADDGDVRIPERLVRGRMPIETATLLAAICLDRREPVERREGDGAVLAVPLAGAGGAIVASTHRGGVAEADRAMLVVMARQLSLTLENLRLRRRLDQLMFRGSPT